jgi:NADPH:quinone reductase-like Zn-dependent oxidoreductase
MRAVALTEFGGPDVLALHHVPIPEPGADEVRIRVHAATVNPADTLFRTGAQHAHAAISGEYVPGMEAAGVVVEVGAAVTSVVVGDRVMAIARPASTRRGAYAEHLVVPARSVARIPDQLDLVHAATLPMNGMTALLGLRALRLALGRTLGVTGAAGAVGGYTIELAKDEGLHVVCDAAPPDVELVRTLGADEVVPRGAAVADAMRVVAPDGVDGLADAAVQLGLVVGAVRPGGSIAVLRDWSGPMPDGIAVRRVRAGDHLQDPGAMNRLGQLVERGVLTPRVSRVFPLEQAADAHRLLETGGVRGRLVLEVD